MPEKMQYPIKRLSFKDTWKGAFSLYLKHFTPLFLLACLLFIPVLFFNSTPAIDFRDEAALQKNFPLLFFGILISIGLNIVSTSVLTLYIADKILDRYHGLSSFFIHTINRLSPIFALSVAIAIIVGSGIFAFLIPGIFFAICLSLSIQILIVEKKGVLQALVRSYQLTQGKRVEILLYTFILAILNYSVQRALETIFVFGGDTSILPTTSQIIPLFLAQGFTAPFNACLFFLIYINIRIGKEGEYLVIDEKLIPAEAAQEFDNEEEIENRNEVAPEEDEEEKS